MIATLHNTLDMVVFIIQKLHCTLTLVVFHVLVICFSHMTDMPYIDFDAYFLDCASLLIAFVDVNFFQKQRSITFCVVLPYLYSLLLNQIMNFTTFSYLFLRYITYRSTLEEPISSVEDLFVKKCGLHSGKKYSYDT